MTMIGASLLWVGWFGFNAGSNLEANGTTALAMINTFVATMAAALAWLFVEWAAKGKPSLLGLLSGAAAGLVAATTPRSRANSVRPDGAVYQWRKVPPSEMSVALVADERFGGATYRA